MRGKEKEGGYSLPQKNRKVIGGGIMSADNVIYIQKKWSYFHVWEQSASHDPSYKNSHTHKKFKERPEAALYALDMLKDYDVEYGVCEL